MLKSELSSNNESSDSTSLLTMGENKLLTFTHNQEDFVVSDDDIVKAKEYVLKECEPQAVEYFAGYILKKIKEAHIQDSCTDCDQFSKKITVNTTNFEASQLFIFLKRYDDDKSTLYAPETVFTAFVSEVSKITHYCLDKYIAQSGLQAGIRSAIDKNVLSINFCSKTMEEKTISLIVRTILNYKLKWINDEIKTQSKKSSQRKLKILKHQ